MPTNERTVRLPASVRRDDQWTGKRFTVAHQARLEIGDRFYGYGKTSAVATADLTANVTRFLADCRPPTVLTLRANVGIVWCDIHDMYGITWHGQVVGNGGIRTEDSRDEALVGLAYQMAQDHVTVNRWSSEEIEAAVGFFGTTRTQVPVRPDERHYGDLRRYAAWHRAADVATTLGENVHAWACEHENEWLDRFDRPTNTNKGN